MKALLGSSLGALAAVLGWLCCGCLVLAVWMQGLAPLEEYVTIFGGGERERETVQAIIGAEALQSVNSAHLAMFGLIFAVLSLTVVVDAAFDKFNRRVANAVGVDLDLIHDANPSYDFAASKLGQQG